MERDAPRHAKMRYSVFARRACPWRRLLRAGKGKKKGWKGMLVIWAMPPPPLQEKGSYGGLLRDNDGSLILEPLSIKDGFFPFLL